MPQTFDPKKESFLRFVASSAMEPQFHQHFEREIRAAFAAYGFGVQLAGTSRQIHAAWIDAAATWSMTLPERGEARTSPDTTCLSHIKQAGLLAYCIAKATPIAGFSPLTDEDRVNFHAAGFVTDTLNEKDLVLDFPHAMAGLSYAEAVFHDYQRRRPGTRNYDALKPPFTKHFRRNFCVLLDRNEISAQALYMIFKTMDLYGYLPHESEMRAPLKSV